MYLSKLSCLIALCTLGVSAVSFSVTACAQERIKGTLVAAIVPNYPPLDYKDPASGQLSGFDVDLGQALAARMGLKLQWEETNFDQMISAVATKRVDVILSGMTDLPERRSSISFVDYLSTGPQFYTLKTRASDFPTMDSLCGKRVGASRRTDFPNGIASWSAEHCNRAGKAAIEVVGTDGSSDARLQLRQNRIDAAVQGAETLPYQNSVEQGQYLPIGGPFLTRYTAIGVGKENTQLAYALTSALNQLISDGTYQKLLAKWSLQQHGMREATLNQGK